MGGWLNSPPPPPRFTPGKETRYLLYKNAESAPGPVWTGAENLAPTGIRAPYRPARSDWLHRLSIPGPCVHLVQSKGVQSDTSHPYMAPPRGQRKLYVQNYLIHLNTCRTIHGQTATFWATQHRRSQKCCNATVILLNAPSVILRNKVSSMLNYFRQNTLLQS
jgi:hypothetical protein